ncbi:MAG: sulfotransferase [Planctomycetes bacterium]|nr:sulfotransferase [Planctomycetota bacterium]
MANEPDRQTPPDRKDTVAKFWEPRLWSGMTLSGWLRLLAHNRFAVSPWRIAMSLIIVGLGCFNSCMGLLQKLIYGGKITRTQIEHDPLFVLGHWRTGTTLLHELMVLDSRHAFADTFACFAPNHFLVTQSWLPRCVGFLLPSHRPMDNMGFDWEKPQEDEFALCNMGIPSPYFTFAFPRRPQYAEYGDLRQVPPEGKRRWKEGLTHFLKCLTLRKGKRIVLKSPWHTCRIETLLELFPKARFIHIVRDPVAVFPSTIKMRKRMIVDHAVQKTTFEGLEEETLANFQRMYTVFEETRSLIDPSRFCEVRYEDLVQDPVGQIRRVYEQLDLGRFDDVLPALEARAAEMAEYKPNRHQLDEPTRRKIARRWATFIETYGYHVE